MAASSGPSPEEYINLLEGQHQLADIMDGMKQALVRRGWADRAAEIAALRLMLPYLETSIAAERNK